MKKIFGLFAAASMLLATSCSNDELESAYSGNEATISFNVGIENGVQTRAISDGLKAKKLVYAVYNSEKELIEKIPQRIITDAFTEENSDGTKTDVLTQKVDITLAKGQTYTVVFWAQNEECKAYNTDDLTDVKISYKSEDGKDALNNDETRDAFYGTTTFTVHRHTAIDVTLKRPFAQINVGVTDEDWKAAVASEITIQKSKVVIKNAATNLNLLTGKATGQEDVTFDFAATPKETEETPVENLSVDMDGDATPEDYHYLSMSYILVNDGSEDGATKSILQDLAFTFNPVAGNDIEFGNKDGLVNVPVQRNWRTNIVGQILTGNIHFTVKIEPAFDNDYKLPYYEELYPGVTYDKTRNIYGISSAAGMVNANYLLFGTSGNSYELLADIDMSDIEVSQIVPEVKTTILNAITTAESGAATIEETGTDSNGTTDGTDGSEGTEDTEPVEPTEEEKIIEYLTTKWTSKITQSTNFNFNGNGYTISNWGTTSNALFVTGGEGSSGKTTIENLILEDCSVNTNNNLGAAMLVGNTGADVTIKNCHIKGGNVTNATKYAAGFVGYYTKGQNQNVSITDSSVKGTNIDGSKDGSAGAFVGHDNGITTIENAIVTGCTIKGEKAIKSGIVIGTVATTTTITTSDISGNTVFDIENSENIYGRVSGSLLTLNGLIIKYESDKDDNYVYTYEIPTAEALAYASEYYFKRGGTYTITADIDMEDVEYKPTNEFISSPTLVIDGNSKTISNLYVESTHAALLGGGDDAVNLTIKNLTIKDSEFIGTSTAAPFGGWMTGPLNFENCKSVNNTIKDASMVAGLLGYTTINSSGNVLFTNCIVDGNTLIAINTDNVSEWPHIAGLIGQINKGTIAECEVKNTAMTYNPNLKLSSDEGQWCVGTFVATPQSGTTLGKNNSVSNVSINGVYQTADNARLIGLNNANWDITKITIK